MASEVVLDASALVAFLRKEAGTEQVAARLKTASITTANLTETADALSRHGFDESAAFDAADLLKLDVVPVDRDLARAASRFYLPTRAIGLSLGDRLCLALAARLNRPALTSDRAWLDVPDTIGVQVELFR